MAKKCGDCRWFSGNECPIVVGRHNSGDGGSCVNFVDHTSANGDKHCRACRWYNGKECESMGGRRNPSDGSSYNKYSAFR